MPAESFDGKSTTQVAATAVAAGTSVQPAQLVQMLNVLESLLSHTHTYYDDYGSNCNCNCNCTRGSL